MPIPMEYQHASDDFERFLAEARERADLTTRNQTWTMIDAVLRAHVDAAALEAVLATLPEGARDYWAA